MSKMSLMLDPLRLDSLKCLATARANAKSNPVDLVEGETQRPRLRLESGVELNDAKAICLFLSAEEFSHSKDDQKHSQVEKKS